MLPSNRNQTPRNVERALYRASETLKGLIAQTPEEFEETQSLLGSTPCERPESLQDADAVLERIIKQDTEKNEPSAFGKTITLLRTQKRLSIEQLAKKTDLDADEITEIESSPNNDVDPMAVTVLAEFFGMSVDRMQRLAGLTTNSTMGDDFESLHLAAGAQPEFDDLSIADRQLVMQWFRKFRS